MHRITFGAETYIYIFPKTYIFILPFTPVTGKKLQGYPGTDEVLIWPSNGTPYYILEKDWKKARYAYGKGTATQAQLEILKYGHYISE